jgi:hypothetical protein
MFTRMIFIAPSRLTWALPEAHEGGARERPLRSSTSQRRGGAPRGRARLRHWRAGNLERCSGAPPFPPRHADHVGRGGSGGAPRVRRSAPAPSRRSAPSRGRDCVARMQSGRPCRWRGLPDFIRLRTNAKPGPQRSRGKAAKVTAGQAERWLFDSTFTVPFA